MHTNFVHLHCHSHYSFYTGTASPRELVRRASELKMPALALTDFCNLHGIPEFCRSAKECGIKPIPGIEIAVAEKSRFDSGIFYGVTLLAMNEEGWRNLMLLSSLAFLEGLHKKPTIDKELLRKHHAGLICLSGFAIGEIGHILTDDPNGGYEKAKTVAQWYHDIFGDRYYLELRNRGIKAQETLFEQTANIGNELSIPTVVANDIHYLNQADAKAHDILLCIKNEKVLSDENRPKMESDQQYFRTAAEMYAAFPQQEAAVERTLEIANRVDPDIFSNFYSKRCHPVFPLPPSKSPDELLHELCVAGLEKRYADTTLAEEAEQRLESELAVIKKLGHANYFLLVADIVRFAEERRIYYTSRGSAVGSLVGYVLGFSHVCPLEFGLLLERFLDEYHTIQPDIDLDIEMERRKEILDYIAEKYGKNNVARVAGFGRFGVTNAVKKVGRVMEVPLEKIDLIVDSIPLRPMVTLSKALNENKQLRDLDENDLEAKELFDCVKQIEGVMQSARTHACAIAIADKPLIEYIPQQKIDDANFSGWYQSSIENVTQWDMCHTENVGVLKMDFLGLRTLSTLTKILDTIKETKGETIDPYKIPLDDRKTFELLWRAETKGVFQLEGEGMRIFLQWVKPDNFREIIAILSLYRPGPLESGMCDQYIHGKNKRRKAEYIHPVMEEILSETYGVMVYQEQMMMILAKLGKIPLADGYDCVKAISKKKEQQVEMYREKFLKGFCKGRRTRKKGEEIFEQIVKYAPYGFCKSHATAYAQIAYIMAYLRANYPEEFAVCEYPPAVG